MLKLPLLFLISVQWAFSCSGGCMRTVKGKIGPSLPKERTFEEWSSVKIFAVWSCWMWRPVLNGEPVQFWRINCTWDYQQVVDMSEMSESLTTTSLDSWLHLRISLHRSLLLWLDVIREIHLVRVLHWRSSTSDWLLFSGLDGTTGSVVDGKVTSGADVVACRLTVTLHQSCFIRIQRAAVFLHLLWDQDMCICVNSIS